MTAQEQATRIENMTPSRYWEVRNFDFDGFIEDLDVDNEMKLDLIAMYPLLSRNHEFETPDPSLVL